MSKSTNSIEINGKRYDARTGLPVAKVHAVSRRKSVDGVNSSKATTLLEPKPKTVLKPLSATKVMDLQPPKAHNRSVAKAARVTSQQPSQTLMRHVVAKPGHSLKRHQPAHGHVNNLVAQPVSTLAPKLSVASVHPARLMRAQTTAKSSRVSKFQAANHGAASTSLTSILPVMPDSSLAHKRLHSSEDVFKQALQRATSHLQPSVVPEHLTRRRQLSKSFSIVGTAVVLLLLVGLLGYQNRAALGVRLAASKAGFNATLPSYKPSGFTVGKLDYSPGNVAINYHSNSDKRAFAITEQPSAWNSSTLRDNFVINNDNQFQTVDVAGRTVYIYGKNNAAWVNGGIWYKVQSEGSLSAQQISQLAKSL